MRGKGPFTVGGGRGPPMNRPAKGRGSGAGPDVDLRPQTFSFCSISPKPIALEP